MVNHSNGNKICRLKMYPPYFIARRRRDTRYQQYPSISPSANIPPPRKRRRMISVSKGLQSATAPSAMAIPAPIRKCHHPAALSRCISIAVCSFANPPTTSAPPHIYGNTPPGISGIANSIMPPVSKVKPSVRSLRVNAAAFSPKKYITM